MGNNSSLVSCCYPKSDVLFSRNRKLQKAIEKSIRPRHKRTLNERLENIKEQDNEEHSCKSFQTGDAFSEIEEKASISVARTTILSVGH